MSILWAIPGTVVAIALLFAFCKSNSLKEKRRQLTQLLKQAQDLHHIYETDVLQGVHDKEWPAWYAQALFNLGADELLPDMSGETLAERLKALSDKQALEEPDANWAEYVAARLI